MERWKINLYTLWVGQVIALMSFGFGIPFIPFYIQELGISDQSSLIFYTGLASTIPAATMVISAPIWGILADRFGRKLMLQRAMLTAVFIIGGMGFVTSVPQLLVLRALQGIFTGTITASMAFVSANTDDKKMSFALGFMTSSNFIGYSIGPVLGGLLAEQLGYRSCFIIGGLLMVLGFLLVTLLVKEDKSTFGESAKFAKNKEERKKLHQVETVDEDTMMTTGARIKSINEKSGIINKTKIIIMILIILFINRTARIIFSPFIPLFVQENINTSVGAATYTGLINGAIGIAGAIAAITLARLGDKYDKNKVVLILSIISLPLTIMLSLNTSLIMFAIFFALFSFVAGGIEPILTSSASEHTNTKNRGRLFGFLGAVGNGAFMISPIIGTYISIKFSISAILFLIPILVILQIIIVYNESRADKE
jgi:DHA1 family multidrug resistance protein-like MFS transporter